MSRPLIQNSATVMLEVTAARKLHADVAVSAAPTNALKVKPDGLYVAKFTPIGACVQQFVLSGGQTFPIYGSGATPSSSLVSYSAVLADNGLAQEGAAMWDVATPTRLTIRRRGRYLVSAHGRYRSSGTYAQFAGAAWISLNGDEQKPLASYTIPTSPGAADPAVLAAPLGTGTTPGSEVYTGAYHCLNEVTLDVGDYVETRVVFASSSASPANTVITMTGVVPISLNFPTQTLSVVQVGEA